MNKILHKRSNAIENGKAKLPTSSQLDYGEIAINFAAGKETISIKNSNDEIVTFPTNSQLEEIEFVTANALNEHDIALNEMNNNFGLSFSQVREIIEENEYVVASALNDLNGRIIASASQLTNDVGFITGYTETDPTVPSWAKQSTKPTYTANEVGALPTGTTLDNVPDGTTRKLSDYSLTGHTHTATEVGALTGVSINGSAATVSNGNASFNIDFIPSVSASDNGKILRVVNGQWTLVTPSTVYTGQGAPDNLLGTDGDIYLQIS